MTLPDFFYNIRFPVRAILETPAVNVNWRWRMAARKMMERENVPGLEEIKKLFNKFFRDHHRFFGDLLDAWISHPQAKKRLFGVTGTAFLASPRPPRTPREELPRLSWRSGSRRSSSAATTAFTTVTGPRWLLSLS